MTIPQLRSRIGNRRICNMKSRQWGNLRISPFSRSRLQYIYSHTAVGLFLSHSLAWLSIFMISGTVIVIVPPSNTFTITLQRSNDQLSHFIQTCKFIRHPKSEKLCCMRKEIVGGRWLAMPCQTMGYMALPE